MNDAETFIELINQSSDSGKTGTAAWVLELRSPEESSELVDRLHSLTGLRAIIEPVFKTEDTVLQRFHRLTINGVPLSSVAALYSFAYWLQDELHLRSCVPDLEHPVTPDFPIDSESAGTEEPLPEDNEWAIKKMNAPKAWAVPLPAGGKAEGNGILIGQIDTGINDHSELNPASLEILSGANFVEGGEHKPIDPLVKVSPFDNPSHGIATCSVVVSRKDGKVTGTAPKAKVMPIRSIRTVVRLQQSTVAQGIDFARENGCHIITMSLGGLGLSLIHI